MRPKLIYFAERHPRFGLAEFRERWLRHGELGMSLPRWRNVARYTQCSRIALAADDQQQRTCDGVATVIFKSEDAWRAHIADADSAITKADEMLTFARPVRDVSIMTTEANLLPHRRGAIRIFAMIRSRTSQDDVFAERWAHRHATQLAMVLSRDSNTGYSHNLVRPDLVTSMLGAASVEEISCDDPEQALAMLIGVVDNARSDGLVSDMEWVATREHVLWPWTES